MYNFTCITYVAMLFQHQQQVATAVDRAKQVTMTELNAIIGVSELINHKSLSMYTYVFG